MARWVILDDVNGVERRALGKVAELRRGTWKGRYGMTREQLLGRISIDPTVCFGKPCIRGRRIWVSLVLDLLASGMKPEQVMQEYDLTEEDILACIGYGAEMARERYIDVPARTET